MNKPCKMSVHCDVDTCAHWKDNFCEANELNVNHMAGKAISSEETCCHTFKCKC